MPEANRFTKVVLGSFFDEPTEMDILPDGRIIFLERKGNIKMYNPKTDSITVINTFNVNTKFEDGMLGLAHDPDFETNNWFYIYYSHPQKSANVLSRFVFDGKKIDQSSEKQMLEVATQREKCCHTRHAPRAGSDPKAPRPVGRPPRSYDSYRYLLRVPAGPMIPHNLENLTNNNRRHAAGKSPA